MNFEERLTEALFEEVADAECSWCGRPAVDKWGFRADLCSNPDCKNYDPNVTISGQKLGEPIAYYWYGIPPYEWTDFSLSKGLPKDLSDNPARRVAEIDDAINKSWGQTTPTIINIVAEIINGVTVGVGVEPEAGDVMVILHAPAGYDGLRLKSFMDEFDRQTGDGTIDYLMGASAEIIELARKML